VVFSYIISLTFNFTDCAVASFDELVQLVLVVDTVVWRCTRVHLQVAFSVDRDTSNDGSHRSRCHSACASAGYR